MAIILVIGLFLLYIGEVKYKETNRLHHLYKKAFSCLGLQDNSNWWLGEKYTQRRTESRIFCGIGLFLIQGIVYAGPSDSWEVYVVLGIEALFVIYLIFGWKTLDVTKPNYSISDIKLIMQDFRDHKDRLKELYDLQNVIDQDEYLDSIIDEAEFLWTDAYNKGYYYNTL